jgi:hypothetical protein
MTGYLPYQTPLTKFQLSMVFIENTKKSSISSLLSTRVPEVFQMSSKIILSEPKRSHPSVFSRISMSGSSLCD